MPTSSLLPSLTCQCPRGRLGGRRTSNLFLCTVWLLRVTIFPWLFVITFLSNWCIKNGLWLSLTCRAHETVCGVGDETQGRTVLGKHSSFEPYPQALE